jgi:hypothetical protein
VGVGQPLVLKLVAELDVISNLPDIGTGRIHGPIVIAFEGGQLGISSNGFAMHIPSMMLAEASFQASQPSDVKLGFDVHLGLDDFTIAIDHQVQKPLLKTELSGWR